MTILLGPFASIKQVVFPAHFDLLAIQCAVNKPTSDTLAGGINAASVGIGLPAALYSGVALAAAVGARQGAGAILPGSTNVNLGNGPVAPADPFTGGMRTANVLFSPAGNNYAVQATASANTPLFQRGYLFLNVSLLAALHPSATSATISVSMSAGQETLYGVLLELIKGAKSAKMPAGTSWSLSLNDAAAMGWPKTASYFGQTTISGGATAAAMNPTAVMVLNGLQTGNYTITNGGTSGLSGAAKATFTSGAGDA